MTFDCLKMKSISVSLFVVILTVAVKFSECAQHTCSTIPCVLSAATIIEKLNSEVNPCENFYDFACGLFGEEVSTPDEKSTVDTLSLMEDNLNEFLLTILSSDDSSKTDDIEIHKIAKDFYASCTKTCKLSYFFINISWNTFSYNSILIPVIIQTFVRKFLTHHSLILHTSYKNNQQSKNNQYHNFLKLQHMQSDISRRHTYVKAHQIPQKLLNQHFSFLVSQLVPISFSLTWIFAVIEFS